MKVSNWSVIPTADGLGVALMADGCTTEICVRVFKEDYEIRVYTADSDDVAAKLVVPADKED